MLTRAEAESIKTNLRRVMAGTIELGDLVTAIDRETELDPPDPPAIVTALVPSRARTRDFEKNTQPIPVETMRQLVDRGRRPTKDLDP